MFCIKTDITMNADCRGGLRISRCLRRCWEWSGGLVMGSHNNKKKEGSIINQEHLLFALSFIFELGRLMLLILAEMVMIMYGNVI